MKNQKPKTIKCSENIALIGDLHLGSHKDNSWTEECIYNSLKYFTDYCKSNGIDTIIQTGDFFDNRKAISHRTMEFNREKIVPLFDGLTVYIPVGNHDLHFKNQILPNSPTELLSNYDNFKVINEPTTFKFNSYSFDLIPWICQENEQQIFDFIKNSDSDFCVGHFELNGFYYYRGLKSHGLETNFLEKYKYVYSGHFHTISSNSNVLYLGTPYTITSGDANDQRGIWIFNTKRYSDVQHHSQFISNPETYHYKLFLSDTSKIELDDISQYQNKSVVVMVQDYSDKKELDKILSKFEEVCSSFKYQITYEALESSEEIADNFEDTQKTMDLVKEEIYKLDEPEEQKELLLTLFNQLYTEALHQ